MKELKNYQIMAIEQLKTFTDMYLKTSKNETIVFQAPTGSGKTLTMARFIAELSESTLEDLCYVWISIGKGNLQVQSYNSVKNEIGDKLQCSLLEEDFFGSRGEIEQNEIVFVNWEKIRIKDKKTNDYKNILMKDSETYNFPNVLENTRNKNRKIILIIDESHYSSTTERAKEIRDEIIQPNLTIEMSATPVFNGENMNSRVSVEPTDVINEGMIKKEIIINENIEEIIEKDDDEKTSEQLVIETAYQKEEELKARYNKLFNNGETEKNIVPLTLIQIPNSNYGDEKRIAIERFLEGKGITTENGKLAVWLSDDKINDDSETLLPLDSKVEYLIFKMAVDTGWDCPRAQILLKFREVSSITFEIQTVGRILRMPEARHYSDEEINKAFVYTNIQSITIKKEIYNPNIIKSLSSKVKEEYRPVVNIPFSKEQQINNQIEIEQIATQTNDKINDGQNEKFINNMLESKQNISEKRILYTDYANKNTVSDNILKEDYECNMQEKKKQKTIITLSSYYKKRTDYGDIGSSFYPVYEREFCKYFEIEQISDTKDLGKIDYNNNKEKLEKHKVKFGIRKKDSILNNVHLESDKVDKGIEVSNPEFLIDIVLSDSDLQNDYEKVIRNNLNGFAPVRSVPTVKQAILFAFDKYLGYKNKNKGIILIQNIVVNNPDIFGKIISISTENYKYIRKYEIEQKAGYEINNEWHIPFDKNYNPNTSKIIESKLSIHQPLYMETKDGKVDQLEVDFIKYIDKYEDKIEYFWKNGSEHMNTNFGIKKEDGTTFQPDFLIQFKDGRIGIFDTKAGKGFNENDNEAKSNALQQYIVDENKKGKNIVGGLVIKSKDKFYYYDRGVYNTYADKPEQWKEFDELLH